MKRVAVFVCVILAVALVAFVAMAGVPRLINYQGILTDDTGAPITGSHDLTFTIYPDSTPSAVALWSEPHTGVEIDAGLFNVILGKTVTIPDSVLAGGDRWMGITVDGGSEMTPRMEITSVPWAFRSAVADSAGTILWNSISGMPAGFADGVDDVGGSGGLTLPYADSVAVAYSAFIIKNEAGGAAIEGENKANNNVGNLGGSIYGASGTNANGNYGFLGAANQGAHGANANGNLGHLGHSAYGAYGGNANGSYGYLGGTSYGVYGAAPAGGYGGYFTGKVCAEDTIQSTAGGFQFPDGSVQTTADIGDEELALPFADSASVAYSAFIIKNEAGGAAIEGENKANNNVGNLGGSIYGASGTNANGNYGFLGAANQGAHGANANGNLGHLGHSAYGAYGGNANGSYGYLGGTSYGVYGAAPAGGYGGYFTGKVCAEDTIQSTAGGFQFPDGSVQTTAVTGGESDGDWEFSGDDIYSAVPGNVGIGTSTPAYKLDVASTVQMTGFKMPTGASFGYILTSDANGVGSWQDLTPVAQPWQYSGDNIYSNVSGNVGIGTTSPSEKLDVAGTTKTDYLEIDGGADLAEPFDIAGSGVLEPGSVVVIDAAQTGALRIATESYDTRVAGVISGAGGIKTGLTLSQSGLVEGGQNVALSGRVYVRATASNGPIHPGDLLTTSPFAGHAMRATDFKRTHGAVLGKAMSTLETGEGLVLILVSLQ